MSGDDEWQYPIRRRELERRSRQNERARCIGEFINRQRVRRRWISFFEIADAHGLSAGPAGSPAYDKTREFALLSLSRSITEGTFEHGGRSRVLYLAADMSIDSAAPDRWLSSKAYNIALEATEPQLPLDVLGCCWLSRDLARQWLARHGSRWPASLEPTDANRAPPRQFLKPASANEAHKAITKVYDNFEADSLKPPNIKEIVKPVQAILRDSGYEASGLRIQQLAGADEHKVRPRKPGATLLSERRHRTA